MILKRCSPRFLGHLPSNQPYHRNPYGEVGGYEQSKTRESTLTEHCATPNPKSFKYTMVARPALEQKALMSERSSPDFSRKEEPPKELIICRPLETLRCARTRAGAVVGVTDRSLAHP